MSQRFASYLDLKLWENIWNWHLPSHMNENSTHSAFKLWKANESHSVLKEEDISRHFAFDNILCLDFSDQTQKDVAYVKHLFNGTCVTTSHVLSRVGVFKRMIWVTCDSTWWSFGWQTLTNRLGGWSKIVMFRWLSSSEGCILFSLVLL